MLLEEHVLLYQFVKNTQQTHQMETFKNYDADHLQIRPNIEESSQGQTCYDAGLCPETNQTADQIPWKAVAQE